MRILLSFTIIIVFFFQTFSNSLPSSKYFGLSESILGVIIEDKVHLYNVSEKYKEIPDSSFDLPHGYKAVIGFGESILGVVIDDEVHLYDVAEKYKETPDSSFDLPHGYKAVIGFGESILGVIIDDEVYLYDIPELLTSF